MQYNSEPQDESTIDISTEVLLTGFLKKTKNKDIVTYVVLPKCCNMAA